MSLWVVTAAWMLGVVQSHSQHFLPSCAVSLCSGQTYSWPSGCSKCVGWVGEWALSVLVFNICSGTSPAHYPDAHPDIFLEWIMSVSFPRVVTGWKAGLPPNQWQSPWSWKCEKGTGDEQEEFPVFWSPSSVLLRVLCWMGLTLSGWSWWGSTRLKRDIAVVSTSSNCSSTHVQQHQVFSQINHYSKAHRGKTNWNNCM